MFLNLFEFYLYQNINYNTAWDWTARTSAPDCRFYSAPNPYSPSCSSFRLAPTRPHGLKPCQQALALEPLPQGPSTLPWVRLLVSYFLIRVCCVELLYIKRSQFRWFGHLTSMVGMFPGQIRDKLERLHLWPGNVSVPHWKRGRRWSGLASSGSLWLDCCLHNRSSKQQRMDAYLN